MAMEYFTQQPVTDDKLDAHECNELRGATSSNSCLRCFFLYLQSNARNVKLPNESWAVFVKRDKFVVFPRLEMNDFEKHLNLTILSNGEARVHYRKQHADWIECQPKSLADISEILKSLDSLEW